MAIQSFLHENERVYESPLAFDKQPASHRISSHRGEIKGRSNLKLVQWDKFGQSVFKAN